MKPPIPPETPLPPRSHIAAGTKYTHTSLIEQWQRGFADAAEGFPDKGGPRAPPNFHTPWRTAYLLGHGAYKAGRLLELTTASEERRKDARYFAELVYVDILFSSEPDLRIPR